MPSATDDPPGPVTDRPRLTRAADPDVLAARLDVAQETAPIRKRLATRADANLPDGHPSSARDENGNPRPPEPSLADVEITDAEASDADWAAHVRDTVNRIDQALSCGLDTKTQYALDPDGESWRPERREIHDELLREVYCKATDVPKEHKAILIGGLTGAGKTTILESHAGIDLSDFVMINPDDFKVEMARRGLVPEIAGLSPMEASALVHEESSHLARQLAFRALRDGKNVIWDITMSSEASTRGRVHDLRQASYTRVDGLFADIPPRVSAARADQRHRHGEELYSAGIGLGGRCPPNDLIATKTDAEFGSINRRNFEGLKDEFDYWAIYDNSVDGRAPRMVECGGTRD